MGVVVHIKAVSYRVRDSCKVGSNSPMSMQFNMEQVRQILKNNIFPNCGELVRDHKTLE